MDKYDGIERASVKFSEAREVKRQKKARERSYLAGFFARVVVAALLVAAVFGLRYLPSQYASGAIETVKTAVTFDLNSAQRDGDEYLTEKLKKLIEDGLSG